MLQDDKLDVVIGGPGVRSRPADTARVVDVEHALMRQQTDRSRVSTRVVRTTHLELPADAQLVRPDRPKPDYELLLAEAITPEYARFLFATVGRDWHWQSRLPWTHGRWQQHLARTSVAVFIAYRAGAPVGYFELNVGDDRANDDRAASDGAVELVFFGLMPGNSGSGLGGHLLADAVERARKLGSGRVWVHTCDHDHPHALANYQARGFRVFKVEDAEEQIVPRVEPWPGAFPPGTTER